MELINFVVMALFVIAGIGFPSYVVYIEYQSRRKEPWRKLAAVANLTYKPTKIFGSGDAIIGTYRGYQLRLDTIRRDPVTEEARTRISLSVADKTPDGLESHKKVLGRKAADVNSALQLFLSSHHLRGEIKGAHPPEIIQYIQNGIETELTYLQSTFDLLCTVANATPVVIELGGEAVETLNLYINDTDNSLRPYLIHILREIGEDTITRLADQLENLLCPRCLTRFEKHKIRIPLSLTPIVYYGCRVCHQSRKYFNGKVIVTLNRDDPRKQYEEKDEIWINWLVDRLLFDFDAVSIDQATDEEVERFVVQVGNDTDETRKQMYVGMECRVSSDCRLTENSLRLLRRMFGRVEIERDLR